MSTAAWEHLIQLVERLPPDKAKKLRELLGASDFSNITAAGFSQMMKTLDLRSSDAGGSIPETLMRHVCKRIEPFLVNQVEEDDAEGTIGRSSLMPWWNAAKAALAEVAEWEAAFSGALANQDRDTADAIVANASDQLGQQARRLPFKGVAAGVLQDIRRIGAVLGGGKTLYDSLERLGLTGPIRAKNKIALAGPLLERFAPEYAKASNQDDFNAIWLGHAAMNRLERPWEVLRLVHAVQASSAKTIKIEDTDLAPLVQRVMSLLRNLSIQSAASIKDASKVRTKEALIEAGKLTAQYFDASEELTEQIKIERDSPWGKIYLAFRKAISELIATKIADFEDILVGFVEEWNEVEELAGPNPSPKAECAFAAADLLGSWRSKADRHGFATGFSALDRRTHALLSRSPGQSAAGKDLWLVHKRRISEGLRLG